MLWYLCIDDFVDTLRAIFRLSVYSLETGVLVFERVADGVDKRILVHAAVLVHS